MICRHWIISFIHMPQTTALARTYRVSSYRKEFGHDPSVDFPEWEPVHEILLGNNVMGIENLGGDIEKVKGQRFMFCAFPLRWYMGDGTIVRAVAFIDEDKINKDVPDRVYKYGVY